MGREKNGGDNWGGRRSIEMLEQELQILFRAPAPRKREAFLAGRTGLFMSHGAFVLSQAAYIRKWVWVLSVAVFGVLVGGTVQWRREALWIAAGMMPFLALIAAQEHMRSTMYNMTELELSTRFSLKSIVLARMGLLGSFHLLLLFSLLPLLVLYGQAGIVRTGVYLLVPYLTTTFFSMVWVRRVRGRESLYLCLGIAVMVSSLQVVGSNVADWYRGQLFPWWLLALVLLLAGNGWECYQAAYRAGSIYENAAA